MNFKRSPLANQEKSAKNLDIAKEIEATIRGQSEDMPEQKGENTEPETSEEE